MAKGTPEVRRFMHADLYKTQMNAVTVPQKLFGHECNPNYDKSPNRIQSKVLEDRVFNSRENNRLLAKKGKKRAQSAVKRGNMSAPQNKRYIVNFGAVSQYANPGERPQHKKVPKVNKEVIMTRLSSDNPAILEALAPKRG